jgi:hypothetical protein
VFYKRLLNGRCTLSATTQLVLLLSLANASISFTMAETKVFRAFREWVKERNKWFGDLLHCGYCLGHWSAFVLTAIYKPRLFQAWWPVDYFLTALVVAWLSAFQWGLLCLLFQKTGK